MYDMRFACGRFRGEVAAAKTKYKPAKKVSCAAKGALVYNVVVDPLEQCISHQHQIPHDLFDPHLSCTEIRAAS